ncbi:DUF305 domain-containing protein [Nocardia cyriacigeorgica]|uniref:DUF305 domain-containing protein n=1 Tax=Nocardia cyriacigeorgica TaxID=135487 RepID=UPI0018941AC6|nr:DUF305 domain-containing protein [Nocardia cyriacigeorgica]MBF6097706.1 DUF305 domain-containing protein [Nocardia cyriacigeorgica]MBF6161651.1 DUF305 domain-containing protein [Nocardia cyriacigeorgica]MBF6200449.1 DUF305 domain-containing protein [Nocardia cyriacigeorgica]MBF6342087.1 DUF305 domain-containing protein [Nocardia cyriacigeorgica]MBF6512949.1 DUF305 domain-containing protein [Nocardia cyriacigeorgica]
MNKTKKALAVGATALAVTFTAAACGDSDTDSTTATTPSAAISATTSAAEDAAAHNDADVMFAQMMIPHHTQAIEMSDMILAKQGIPEPVTALANQIKAAQGPEIDQLTTWLGQWGEPTEMPSPSAMPGHDMPEMDGMEGMMSEEDMQALSDAQGTEAARLFLNQMIAHHEGAIDMAQTEIEDGQFPDAVQMARTIVDTQQQEIDTMRQLLTTL